VASRSVPDRVRDRYMTFGNEHGSVGLKGHLYQRTPGDWRFKVTDPVLLPVDGAFRIRVCAPITVASHDEDPLWRNLETETVNFGADGVLVDGGTDWEPPEHADLTLSLLGENEPIEAPAVLVARQGALCHFKFEAMDTKARNRLCCFIIEYQRDVLRRRKAWYHAEVGGLDDDLDF
jgi:hypothetical protein